MTEWMVNGWVEKLMDGRIIGCMIGVHASSISRTGCLKKESKQSTQRVPIPSFVSYTHIISGHAPEVAMCTPCMMPSRPKYVRGLVCQCATQEGKSEMNTMRRQAKDIYICVYIYIYLCACVGLCRENYLLIHVYTYVHK